MGTPLTTNAFLDVVRSSGLIPDDVLANLPGLSHEESPVRAAERLVAADLLTAWQADKLLHGKHRGLRLGSYRLLGDLGRGGMSSVYRAIHELLERPVAIKVFASKPGDDFSNVSVRFETELEALKKLDHPGIVQLLDADRRATDPDHPGICFLVMAFVDGVTLQERVLKHGPLNAELAVKLLRSLAAATHHAHTQGVIHRDIKPANILLRQDTGDAALADFGLALVDRLDSTPSNSAATVGQPPQELVGSPEYMAPEQADPQQRADARSDVFGLGATAYFLLSGHAPFAVTRSVSDVVADRKRGPKPLQQLCPEVDLDLCRIVERMLEFDPQNRFPSAVDVVDELKRWEVRREPGGPVQVDDAPDENSLPEELPDFEFVVPRALSGNAHAKRKSRPWLRIAVRSITGGFLVASVVAAFVLWREFDLISVLWETPPDKDVNSAALIPEILYVGPQEKYVNLAAALDFVRGRFVTGASNIPVVRLRAGEHAATLQLTSNILDPFPSPVIVEGESGAVLVGNGTDPVIQLVDVMGITFRSLTIDAKGADTAIVLRGRVVGSRILDLTVTGFADRGLELDRVLCFRGDERELLIDRVCFLGESAKHGIRADPVRHLESFVIVRGCSFGAGVECGVSWGNYSGGNTVRDCVFWNVARGIAFTGVDPVVVETTIANNTWVDCGVGITFEGHPGEASRKLRIYRNLFVDSAESDCRVFANFSATEFQNVFPPQAGDLAGNLTTRATLDPAQGDVDLFTVGDSRKSIDRPQFLSSQLGDPQFGIPVQDDTVRVRVENEESPHYAGASLLESRKVDRE